MRLDVTLSCTQQGRRTSSCWVITALAADALWLGVVTMVRSGQTGCGNPSGANDPFGSKVMSTVWSLNKSGLPENTMSR